ncbi:MAG: aminomethyl-transferring glycine dehydrogenase subunit GcvPB [Rhodospirillales bacterium]|nr:MAG: aminomethyl-transferring glycine dehydrogenase subunit GcvPB [Rhodospirillales bacterium]
MTEPTVYELSAAGRCGLALPEIAVPKTNLPEALLRRDNGLPELAQRDVVRHFLKLSQHNFGVDSGFYPLGSCTMKYNPKVCEDAARLDGFAASHPLQPPETVQGNLALMFELQESLKEIGGFAGVSLQPAAGAQGELTALLMMRAWHADRGETQRRQVLIPDSAHGTNPASATMAGLDALEIPSDTRGNIDLEALRAACDETVVALMLTNPNTLGLFEEGIEAAIDLVHGCGGLVYGDGANMNALTGIARPGDFGIDLMHYNLHKTFGTPHGGGGPGAGPLGASAALADYLPGPIIARCGEGAADDGTCRPVMPAKSIGRMGTYFGNFGMLVRAYAYIRLHGTEGLRQNAIHAVLNANYLRVQLADRYPVPYDRRNMHEFVCEGRPDGSEVRAIDVSKRLMDYGFHPPTNYFPLIVAEALMIEPTETESRETLDAFADAMRRIADEAIGDPDLLRAAPHTTPVGRLDEVRAAKQLILCDPAAPDTED